MPKKILILAESIDTNDSSGTKGRVALIKNMASAGYQVTVLHYTRHNIQLGGDIETIQVKERKLNILYLLGKFQTYLYKWFKVNIGWTMQQWFGFSFSFFNDAKSIAKALCKFSPNDYDQLWALSKGNSYRTHKAVLESPNWHFKWYAYVHDPYPSHLYPRPFNYVHSGYRQKHRFFREISKSAFKMVYPSQLLSEWMLSYFPATKGKIIIVPHQIISIDVSGIQFPAYFNPENFNILLAGNLLRVRHPRPLVEALKLFLKTYPEAQSQAQLLIIGSTSGFGDYLKEQQKQCNQIYVSEGYQEFKRVYKMQQSADVNIILEANAEISPFLPGKFPHCVEANKPIVHIGPYLSEVKRVLGANHPYIFQNTDIKDIAEALGTLYKLWKSNPNNLKLDRPDLKQYLSFKYLKEI